jgi:hypothetical protein
VLGVEFVYSFDVDGDFVPLISPCLGYDNSFTQQNETNSDGKKTFLFRHQSGDLLPSRSLKILSKRQNLVMPCKVCEESNILDKYSHNLQLGQMRSGSWALTDL